MRDRTSLALDQTPLMLVTVSLMVALISACNSSGGSDKESPDAELPSLSIADADATEGDSGTANMTFVVTLSKSSSEIVTVEYSTSNGSATAGVDYQASIGTLQFAAGDTLQTISVTIQGDTDVEASETLIVTLSSPEEAQLSQASATGTITNDDFIWHWKQMIYGITCFNLDTRHFKLSTHWRINIYIRTRNYMPKLFSNNGQTSHESSTNS